MKNISSSKIGAPKINSKSVKALKKYYEIEKEKDVINFCSFHIMLGPNSLNDIVDNYNKNSNLDEEYPKLNLIINYCDRYQPNLYATAFYDSCIEIVDTKNFRDEYGYKTNYKKILQLNFPGTHDWIYGIPLPDTIKEEQPITNVNIDELPVYMYEFDCTKVTRIANNFKYFILHMLEGRYKDSELKDELRKDLLDWNDMVNDLSQFSDKSIEIVEPTMLII